MKVYVFGTRGFPGVQGGVEKHCEALYPLLSSDADITVFRRRSYVEPMDSFGGVDFIDLPSGKLKGVEALLHSLLCAVVCLWRRPDIVHVHNIGPGVFIPLLRLFGLHVVLTYHSANYEHSKWGKLSKLMLRISERIALRWSDRIIFVSQHRFELQRESVKRKSVWIPNGVGDYSSTQCTDYIDSMGLSVGKYILAVGRITPEKGFIDLVRAFNQMSCDCGYKLVIAGGVEHENRYMSELRAEGGDNVMFVGAVDKKSLQQLYSHTALFVMPSHNEEAPIAPLEAMCCGAPLLLSDIPAARVFGLSEMCYFKMGDVGNLTDALTERLNERETEYSFDAEYYNWRNIAERCLAVYKSALGTI